MQEFKIKEKKIDETINKKANKLTMLQQNEGSFENIKMSLLSEVSRKAIRK